MEINFNFKMRNIIFIIIIFFSLSLYGEIQCKACKFSNDNKTKYCEQCGASLAEKVLCPECAYENNVDDQYCLNCSAQLIIIDKTIIKEPKKNSASNDKINKEQNNIKKEYKEIELPDLLPLKKNDSPLPANKEKYKLYIDNSELFQVDVKIDDTLIKLSPCSLIKLFLSNPKPFIQVFNKPGFAPLLYDVELMPDMQNVFNPDRKGVYEVIKDLQSVIPAYKNDSSIIVSEIIENKTFFSEKTVFGLDEVLPLTFSIENIPSEIIKLKKVINKFNNVEHAYNILMQDGIYYDIYTMKSALKFLKENNHPKLIIAAINVLSYPLGWKSSAFVNEVTEIVLKNWSESYNDNLIKSTEKLNIKDGYFQAYAIVKILLTKNGLNVTKNIFEKLNETALKNLIHGITFPITGVIPPSRDDARQYITLLVTGIKSSNEEIRKLACEGMHSLILSLNDKEIDYTVKAVETLSNEDFKKDFIQRLKKDKSLIS